MNQWIWSAVAALAVMLLFVVVIPALRMLRQRAMGFSEMLERARQEHEKKLPPPRRAHETAPNGTADELLKVGLIGELPASRSTLDTRAKSDSERYGNSLADVNSCPTLDTRTDSDRERQKEFCDKYYQEGQQASERHEKLLAGILDQLRQANDYLFEAARAQKSISRMYRGSGYDDVDDLKAQQLDRVAELVDRYGMPREEAEQRARSEMEQHKTYSRRGMGLER